MPETAFGHHLEPGTADPAAHGIGQIRLYADGSAQNRFGSGYRVLAKGKASGTRLAEVMTKTPTTMSPKKTAIDALRLMWDGGFRHVPLIERGRIKGVVSRGDFQSDEQLRLDEERQLWEHMR